MPPSLRAALLTTIALALTVVAAPAAAARPGTLVRAFGDRGTSTQGFGTEPGSGGAKEVAPMPDGGFIVRTESSTVGRYFADGTLDTAFGEDGFLLGRNGHVSSVATTADGGIYALGPDWAVSQSLRRLRPDGSTDPSFGSGGAVSLPSELPDFTRVATASGSVYLIGASGEGETQDRVTVLCLGADGAPRQGFGNGGLVDFAVSPVSLSVQVPFAIDGDGLVFAAGGNNTSPLLLRRVRADGSLDPALEAKLPLKSGFGYPTGLGLPEGGGFVIGDGNGSVLKLLPDGSPDPDFGNDGIVKSESLKSNEIEFFLLGADGRMYFAANTYDSEEVGSDLVFAGLLADGEPDPALGATGTVLADAGGHDHAAALTTLADGDLLLSGGSRDRATEYIAAVRYSPLGVPVAGFGSGGLLLARPLIRSKDVVEDIVTRPGGRLIVRGRARGTAVVMAFDRRGRLEGGFGDGGLLSAETLGAPAGSTITAIAPLGRDRVVVATATGWTGVGESPDVPGTAALIAIHPDGSVDRAFGEDGELSLPGFSRVTDFEAGRPAGGLLLAGFTRPGCDLGIASLQPGGELELRPGSRSTDVGFRGACRNRDLEVASRPGGGAYATVVGTRRVIAIGSRGGLDRRFELSVAAGRVLPKKIGSLAVGRDGALLVGGTIHDRLGVVRLTPRGRTARRFGFRGMAVREVGRTATVGDMRVEADGSILVSGTARTCVERPCAGSVAVVARFLPDGHVDKDFGRAGVWIGSRHGAALQSMVFDSADSMVVAGSLADEGDPDMLLSKVRR